MESKFAPKLKDDSVKQRIFELHNNGINAVDIAKEIGVAPPSIRNFLKKYNLVFNKKYESGKNSPKITPEKEKVILDLHKNGYTNVQIGNEIGVSNTAVRIFLKKHNLKSNDDSIKRKRNCLKCSIEYIPVRGTKGYDIYNFCSKECSSIYISENRGKYKKEDIVKVIELKKDKIPNSTIEEKTGVNLNKIKEIVKENQLFLSKEDTQKNVTEGKFKKDPNFLETLRQGHMKYSVEEYERILLEIKQKCEKEEGSVGYVSQQYGLNPNSVVGAFHRRGWGKTINKASCKGMQSEIYNFISKTLGVDCINNCRKTIKPYEIDIFIPSVNLGIELCGLFWHSEERIVFDLERKFLNKISKNKTYLDTDKVNNYNFKKEAREKHFNKYKIAKEKGVFLLTVFEDEWVNKKDIVKSIISNRLNISDRIYARNCQVSIVDGKVANVFLEENHIQGAGHSNIYIGLFSKGDLVGVMTGGDSSRGKNQDLILNRMCFKKGVRVIGGSSKMFKLLKKHALENNYKNIVSFSDNRWSKGSVYKAIGFEKTCDLKPDYFYITDLYRLKRVNKQSKKRKDLVKLGATGKNEFEMANSLNYFKIWDCGKQRWVFRVN
jgi:predicted transcriptional regulator